MGRTVERTPGRLAKPAREEPLRAPVVRLEPEASAARERGREEMVEELFGEEYDRLLGLAYCILGDRCSAEDVVMDAYCSLCIHWSSVRDRNSPLGYLRAAVLNGCRSRIRSLARERTRAPWIEPPPVDVSAGEVIARDEAHRVTRAVRALPHRQREVVVCRYFLDLGEAETAELLGISLRSVKRHAHRARAALATALEVTG
jgi:RNA polymerase sigma factor (sigma-70 family)